MSPARNITRRRSWLVRTACVTPLTAGLLAVGASSLAPVGAPAAAEDAPRALPAPPAGGVMGFVVETFQEPVVFDKAACPTGTVPRLRDAYLATLPAAEAARLRLDENKQEWDRRWQSYGFGEDGANLCTNPDMFHHAAQLTVRSPNAWGLHLDGGAAADTCSHEEFVSPTGEPGIDNQEYRAMGCTPEWRGVDGVSNDRHTGLQQFYNSGEWTQVILLKGVDNLRNDPNVEVILANTADRPVLDTSGKWLRGASFAISDKAPRERNVLHGRIVDGVLTTDPVDIKLAQTWGQGGARDLRGIRGQLDMRKARMRLTFQPDGSLKGMMGGYRPIFDILLSPSLGGAGSVLVTGFDCAAAFTALQQMADGLKDPKTGKCQGVSAARQISAIPAFVTDIPATRTAAR